MLGSVALSEKAISDDVILLAGVAEMSGIGSKASAAIGIMSGVRSISGIFTQTSTGMYISGNASAELSGNITQSTAGLRARLGEVSITGEFTQTEQLNATFVTGSTQSFNIDQSSIGDILWEGLTTDATDESWSELSTTATTESWSDVSTSATEEDWTDLTR